MSEPADGKAGPSGSVVGAVGFGLGMLLLKLKGGLALLKLAPLGKLLPTALSMGAMIWFEALRAGLVFAVGFVLLILIHELGHGYAIKKSGLEAGWPVFIPFFGAMISLRGQVPSADVEAEIAYGGPLWGTVASLACAALGLTLHSRLLMGLAYTGFFLNLFNLVPISPLDGGRIAQAFSRRSWILGALLLGGMFLIVPSFQLALIAGLGLMQAFRPSHGELPPEKRSYWTRRYFGLCFFLGLALLFSSRLLGQSV